MKVIDNLLNINSIMSKTEKLFCHKASNLLLLHDTLDCNFITCEEFNEQGSK